MGDFPDLIAKIKDLHRRNIKVFPAHTNRASSIGAPCIRQLVYDRVAWRLKKPWDINSQLRLDEGNNQEAIVIRDLLKSGVEIIETQVSDVDEKTNTTMHLDGVVVVNDVRYPLEIKSCAPYIFQAIRKYDSDTGYYKAMFELGELYPWLRKYPAQINLYLYSRALEYGIVIFKDKSSGDLKQFKVKLNLEFLDEIFKKAEKINDWVDKFKAINPKPNLETKEADPYLPDRIDDRAECKLCTFAQICLPDINFGSPLKIKDDPGFEKKIDKWQFLNAASKEYKRLNDEIGEQCHDVPNLVLGKYHITGKFNKNKNWLKKIEFIDDDDKNNLIEKSKEFYNIMDKNLTKGI